ncbi:MAG: SDR family NAD(P)-dependent oxidoreductase [Deltaproteobacteria bacterium]|nr:SDR family NAD(P)-dependent oxidoreductase [Deltaproteobacteria bacterium]
MRYAVITGAASGFGRAFAVALARRKWRVLIADINTAGAEETRDMVTAAGGIGTVVRCDVTVLDDVIAMADRAFSEGKRVDLLINNAGIAVAGPVGDASIEDWQWIVSVNFWGVLHGCHVFVPRMREQGGGHIVNVASAGGFVSLPEMPAYNVTKAAVISLSETMRCELAAHNIGVSVVCPSFFRTGLVKNLHCTSEYQKAFATAAVENGRMTADEIAERTLRAVEKNKLYVIPHVSIRLLWLIKRLSPTLYCRTMISINRSDRCRALLLEAARRGLC